MYYFKSQRLFGITNDQILLLRAALLEPNEAIKYWQLWRNFERPYSVLKNTDSVSIFSNLDTESLRLLPLIYKNIGQSNDLLLPILKETYRMTCMQNLQLLKKAQDIVKFCNEEGIPTMLLKGLPMSLVYYKDMGVRPMGDVDLLVPLENVDKTVKLLSDLGHTPEVVEEKYRDYIHAMHCSDLQGWDVDLHWQVFFFQDGSSVSIQSDAVNCQEIALSASLKTTVLNDSLQLFHTIIHGLLEGKGILRWITDAVAILRTEGVKIDYEFLNRYAKQTNTDQVLMFGLKFIEDLLGQKIEGIAALNRKFNAQIFYLRLTKWGPRSFLAISLRMLLRNALHCILFRPDKPLRSQIVWFWGMLRLRIAQSK